MPGPQGGPAGLRAERDPPPHLDLHGPLRALARPAGDPARAACALLSAVARRAPRGRSWSRTPTAGPPTSRPSRRCCGPGASRRRPPGTGIRARSSGRSSTALSRMVHTTIWTDLDGAAGWVLVDGEERSADSRDPSRPAGAARPRPRWSPTWSVSSAMAPSRSCASGLDEARRTLLTSLGYQLGEPAFQVFAQSLAGPVEGRTSRTASASSARSPTSGWPSGPSATTGPSTPR